MEQIGVSAAVERGMPSGGRGLSHAYIVSGPAGAVRSALADRVAASYVCTGAGGKPCGACSGCRKAAAGIHPDIIRAGGSGEPINVAAVRALRSDAYVRPNEAPRKVYVLDEAQEMNSSAQNALLKVLEDGPSYAAFLLLTENEAALLPTIRSRCEILRMAPENQEEDEPGPQREAAETLAGLLTGGDEFALASYAVALEKWDRASLAALLEETLYCMRKRLEEQAGGTRELLALAEQVRRLRRACEFNVGAGHLAGWLAAGTGELRSGLLKIPCGELPSKG